MKKLSVTMGITIMYAGVGLLWTLLGILRITNLAAREGILEYILLGLSIIATTISLLPKRDSFDEMAGDHLRMALSIGFIAIMATTSKTSPIPSELPSIREPLYQTIMGAKSPKQHMGQTTWGDSHRPPTKSLRRQQFFMTAL